MIEIRICPETPAQLQTLVRLLTDLSHGGVGEPANTNADQAKPVARRGRRKAKAEPAEATTEPVSDAPAIADTTPEAPAEPAMPAETSAETAAPAAPTNHSHRQVVDALQDFAHRDGHLALKELLDRFGARRASELRPEHYAEVMAAIGERAAA